MSERIAAIPVTLSFLCSGSQVLLQRRAPDRDRFAGLWNGVGGHVEAGEDVRSGALREIREETGLVPDQIALRAVIHESGLLGRRHMLFVFRADLARPAAPSQPESESRWFERDRLPLAEAVPDLAPLMDLLERRGGVAFGVQRFDGGDRPLELRLSP